MSLIETLSSTCLVRAGEMDELMDLLDGVPATLVELVIHVVLRLQDLKHGNLGLG